MIQRVHGKKWLSLLGLASILLGGCSRTCKGGASDPQEMLPFIPADVSAWAELDLRKALQSELGKQLLVSLEKDPLFQKERERWKTTCGFDPLKQIHKIFATVPAESNPMKMQSSLIVVVQGEFEEESVRKCLDVTAQDNQAKLTETKYGRYRTYELSFPGSGIRSGFVFPTGKNWVMISSRSRLTEALALPDKKGASIKDNKAFLEAFQRTRSPDTVIWGLGLVPPEIAKQWNEKAKERLAKYAPGVDLSRLREFNLVLTMSQGISLRFAANLGNKDQAQKIANLFNEWLNEEKKTFQSQQHRFAGFLAAVKLYDANEDVVLEIPLSEENVKSFMTLPMELLEGKTE